MSEPIPPSEAEQRARSAYATSVERGNMPSPWIAKAAFDECARLRALLGEVCGAADAVLASSPDDASPPLDGTSALAARLWNLHGAVLRARSTP